jgi:type I restriction enzyme S subunit
MMENNIINTQAFNNTEIPSDWGIKKFEEFAKFFSGGTPLTSKPEYYSGNIPFIKSGEIYFDKTEQYISEEGLQSSSAKMVNIGDLLYALYGANSGEVAISKINGAINQAILCIRNDIDSDTVFLYNFLLSQKESIISTYLQGGQGNLSAEIIKSLSIPLPPLPEQKAIAQVLSTADAAIHTTEKLIAQKELRKKWLMQQLLTGKKRLKGFGGEWREKKMSDLFDRVTRKNTEGNTTVVTISAQRGFVRQTDFFNKNIASEITDNYFLVEKGEFCYNKSYSNGYPWGATKRLNDFEKAVVTTLYICFGVKDTKKSNPEFFEQFFGANHLDKGLTKIAHEGGRAHGLLNVTPSDFFSLKVTVPLYEEQTAIAQVLQAADKEISLLKAKADKLRE